MAGSTRTGSRRSTNAAGVEVDALCLRAGEDALVEVGITDIHPELIALLGRLRYRTSYGQNVLKHLIETAHLAGLMASELRLDPVLVKRGAFLHDIGKALTHEVEGSHALIGADLARRYGESEEVVHAIEAHHNEVAPHDPRGRAHPGGRRLLRRSARRPAGVPGVLRQAAGADRGDRPAHEGVEKVFCMQAGREVRVMVLPEDDRRHPGAGPGPRHRQAGRGGADLPRPDQGHRGPRVPGHRTGPLSPQVRPTAPRVRPPPRARRPQRRVRLRRPWWSRWSGSGQPSLDVLREAAQQVVDDDEHGTDHQVHLDRVVGALLDQGAGTQQLLPRR